MNRRCLVPWCRKDAKSRGLCGMHYDTALRLTRSGGPTWEEFVRRKKCLQALRPSKRLGKAALWFMDDLRWRKRAQKRGPRPTRRGKKQ